MYILGMSCFYHDSAACLLKDGGVLAAAQEERFSRKKHDERFPANAIEYCLSEAGISIKDVSYVGFYDKPFLKFERILYSHISTFPWSFVSFTKAMPVWIGQKLWIKDIIRRKLGYHGEILFAEHHMSHAASCFLVSPFKEAAILTVDAVGEWATASYGVGRDCSIEILKEVNFPNSLGLLYSAFTYYLGFKVNSGEYKVMGLAPYGRPVYYDQVKKLVDIKEDGSFKLATKYFAFHYGLKMTNGYFNELFGGEPRQPGGPIERRHMDIAASIQIVTEEILLKMTNYLHKETKMTNLCMAGGVALNCVANGKILRATPFKNIFVQPAAGDAGGAIGVASFVYHTLLGHNRNYIMKHAYLGPKYSDDEVLQFLSSRNIKFSVHDLQHLVKIVAKLIEEKNIIGWYQDRMEFGPRALGNRSILADPRDPGMKDKVNKKVKLREAFRPFAPAVLESKASEYFDLTVESPFMLLVAPVKKKVVPAVTHVDGTARIQTVRRDTNALFYALIEEFYHITGVPIILNTSFNIRGEPIVCSPEEAYRCFMRTDIDYLVINKYLLDKKEMHPWSEDAGLWKQIDLD